MLFCLLLAGTQALLTLESAGSPVSGETACACAGCAPSSCCACSGAPASQPAPAAPSRLAGHTELSWVAAGTALFLATPGAPVDHFATANLACFLMGHVPI